MGDSRYVVEPNIKEGKGGLRDLHTLIWITKYVYGVDDTAELIQRGLLHAEEHRRFVQAMERSEESRVGEECVRTGRSGGSPCQSKKTKRENCRNHTHNR